MIISRTPFRMSFFGGGTDYPAWFEKHKGAVLATTIDKYCYITCRYLPPFFEHNLYYGFSTFARINYNTYSFAAWKSTFNRDSANPETLNANPLFVNASGVDFRLEDGSPARNRGVDILDLNHNGSTTDSITLGAYIVGDEVIGPTNHSSPSAPVNLRILVP